MTLDPPIQRGAAGARRHLPLLLATLLVAIHFLSFDVAALPIVTDARYYLYFAWRVAAGDLPHVDLFDNKNQLATFAGALLFGLGEALGADPLLVVRAGYLALAALGGLLLFTIQRRIGRGSPLAGVLGLLAYTSFGLLGLLPATGNVPKVLMAVFASAMALAVQRGRWFLAGLAAAGAFLDWQIGALAVVAALVSALCFGNPRRRAAASVLLGAFSGLAPFAAYLGLRGGLGAAFEQTVVASFFRGSASLQRDTFGDRFDRLLHLIQLDCPGQSWLVPLGLLGLVLAAVRLRRWTGSDEQRLLVPLCTYHAGVLSFTLLDFQWHGDLFLLLHTVAFFLGLGWIGLLELVRDRVLAGARPPVRAGALGVLVVIAIACARPGPLRPALSLEIPGLSPELTLAAQREVAAEARTVFEGRTVALLEHSEILFLARQRNALPVIYWNNATWSNYRNPDEAREETAARLLAERGRRGVRQRTPVAGPHRRTRLRGAHAALGGRNLRGGAVGSLALRAAPLLVCLAACGGEPAPGAVLVTLDTLRADHLSSYGAADVDTPHMDRLAREGLSFECAAAPMALTRPSHFTILTAEYPREHGVMNNTTSLPDEALTLPEVLRSKGYRTAAFVAVSLLGEGSGADQGFERFEATGERRLLDAPDVVPRAAAWLADVPRDEPFFLWLHLFDPHLPYAPPPAFRHGLDPPMEERLPEVSWQALTEVAESNGGDVPRRVLEHARALYRAEVRHTDHWIGRLVAALTELGRLDHTLIALTADHGESFEHGVFFEHADSLYEGAIRVPLILRLPGRVPAGRRVASQVSLVDVAPTILDALDIGGSPGTSGVSLLGTLDPERSVLLQSPFYQPAAVERRAAIQRSIKTVAGEPALALSAGTDVVGVVSRDWRLLRRGERHELYARSADGLDVADQHPEVVDELRAALDAALSEHALKILDTGEINAEMLETLRALGYVE